MRGVGPATHRHLEQVILKTRGGLSEQDVLKICEGLLSSNHMEDTHS
jgi:hypothetical protein